MNLQKAIRLNLTTAVTLGTEESDRCREVYRGGSRIFFRRGCTRLLLYFNTNKPHSFFFRRIPAVLENHRSSQGGGGGAHPLHPPPRSAPGLNTSQCVDCSTKE